jgi:hypothetical protein
VDSAPHNPGRFGLSRCIVRLKIRASLAYADPHDHLGES